MSEVPNTRSEISIWFFCGILMLAYGLVLVVTGVLEFKRSSPNEVLLPWLQPLIRRCGGGCFLGIFGAFYTVRFRPGKA